MDLVTLNDDAYGRMTAGSRLLLRDRHGEKLRELRDGTYLKLFRRKRTFSSAAWNPYAVRFERAAFFLKEKDILTVRVTGLYRVPSIGRDAVVYDPLEGETLRDAAARLGPSVLEPLAGFLAAIHAKGVYFRAGHLGNILACPGGSLGLIDVSECRVRARALGVSERVRSFRPLVRYEEDQLALKAYGASRLVSGYLEKASLDMRARAGFLRRIADLHPLFRTEALV